MATGNFAKTILTFTVGAAVAFAQAAGSPSPANADNKTDPHGHGAHSADHGMSSNKGLGVLVGPGDQNFIIKTAQSELMEVEAARLAQEKGSSNEIKEYARKLEQDHTKSSNELKELAAQKNVDLPTDAGKHAAMLEKIRNLSGDKFDKEFMKMQVKHHKNDVNAFQKQTTQSMDSDVKAFATATLPTLQGHLQQAEQLQASTRGRSATTTSSPTETKADDSSATTNK